MFEALISEYPSEASARYVRDELELSDGEIKDLLQFVELRKKSIRRIIPRHWISGLVAAAGVMIQFVPQELFTYFDVTELYAAFRAWTAIITGALLIYFGAVFGLPWIGERRAMAKLDTVEVLLLRMEMLKGESRIAQPESGSNDEPTSSSVRGQVSTTPP